MNQANALVPLQPNLPRLVMRFNKYRELRQTLTPDEIDFYPRFKLGIILPRVDQAIQLAIHGGYGFCQKCFQPIPPERLEAVPAALFCCYCQKLVEAKNEPK